MGPYNRKTVVLLLSFDAKAGCHKHFPLCCCQKGVLQSYPLSLPQWAEQWFVLRMNSFVWYCDFEQTPLVNEISQFYPLLLVCDGL